MMDRRDFLRTGGMWAGAVLIGRVSLSESAAAKRLRTITYNVYGGKGWPEKQGNRARLAAAQPRMPERIALELAIYDPDIVSLAEAPEEPAVARIAQALGMTYAFYPGPEAFPGALLSRGRILESMNCPLAGGMARPQDLLTRHFGRAIVETPLGECVVFNAHLHPNSRPIRLREIALILDAMKADLEGGRSVLLQGDLNHKPDTPEYEQWLGAGLVDAFAAKGTGVDGTVVSTQPKSRIDYIWAHGPLAARIQECRTLFEGAFRVNMEDPASFALSDHLPVLAEFA